MLPVRCKGNDISVLCEVPLPPAPTDADPKELPTDNGINSWIWYVINYTDFPDRTSNMGKHVIFVHCYPQIPTIVTATSAREAWD